jgi:hypothetical protein
MLDAGLITKKMFNLCLGKNGGYFQIGGYNTAKHLEPVMWFDMQHPSGIYDFKLSGVSLGNKRLEGSDKWTVAFVDSGTTSTYMPIKMWNMLAQYFDDYCLNSVKSGDGNSKKYCPGKRIGGTNQICFQYDRSAHPNKRHFFLGFPVINIHAFDINRKE